MQNSRQYPGCINRGFSPSRVHPALGGSRETQYKKPTNGLFKIGKKTNKNRPERR